MLASRMYWQNFATFGASIITASSSLLSFPVRRLRDSLRGNRWRSATGWTIVAGFNDKIDFNRGGVKAATITAGTYATGAALATAVLAALEAADATPVWACSYSVSTFKFTISSDTAFVLLWLTGSNVIVSAGVDLGFAVTDSASGTTFTGASASYQSRHYITVDIGAVSDVRAMIVHDHNAGTSGTFTFKADAASTAGALVTWDYTAPSDNTENKDLIRTKILNTAQTFRYWALVISDVQNADGFAEIGRLYLGDWLELDLPSRGLAKAPVDYSNLSFADQGAQFQDRKQRTRLWDYSFDVLSESQVDELDSAATQLLTGGALFFQRDPYEDDGRIIYVFLTEMPKISQDSSSGDRWSAKLMIQEALV